LLVYLPRALWVCLSKYPISTVGSVLFTRTCAESMNLDPMDAVFSWCASALLASGVWYTLEPWVQRLWGARPPNEREWLRLDAASGGTVVSGGPAVTTFLLEESSRVGVHTGLRTIVLTRGALDELSDQQLGKLLAHGVSHLTGRSATPYVRCDKACMAL
jgi:hypothetical protein